MKTIDLQNVKEFMNLLIFKKENQYLFEDEIIFRGAKDSSYDLTPSAFRPEKIGALKEICEPLLALSFSDFRKINSESSQKLREVIVCGMFYRKADQQGLTLPSVPHDIHKAFTRSLRHEDAAVIIAQLAGNWPVPAIWPCLGLAQHYGVPTRLLDWSSQPLTAAYFAAAGALSDIEEGVTDPSQKLAVWGCQTPTLLEGHRKTHGGRAVDGDTDIEDGFPYQMNVIDAPRSGNPNLNAQKGRFTIVSKNEFYETSKWPVTLDQALNINIGHAARSEHHNIRSSYKNLRGDAGLALSKVTLPVSRAPELLERLRYLGYSAERLFPGYDGAVKGIMESVSVIKHSRAGMGGVPR